MNADDFGRSSSINHAVMRAHVEGILTSASLMVEGAAAEEAVEIACEHPGLGVGLHLALSGGRATLPHDLVPALAGSDGSFRDSPIAAGLRYFLQPGASSQLEREIRAQIRKFRSTGLRMDHVNGHHNMHMHPSVLRLLLANRVEWGITHLRWVHDPLWLNARLDAGRWVDRIFHGAAFGLLSWRARALLRAGGIHHTDRVFGLLQTGRVDEQFLLKLLTRLPAGDSEVYSHPCMANSAEEFRALVSPAVKSLIERLGIQTIRYSELGSAQKDEWNEQGRIKRGGGTPT